MLWSTINRTILWELIKIFVLALISITGMLMLAVVVMEAQNQGLGPLQIMAIIPLVIPSTLPYTIPATTLFATCVVYGRLAADNEILAIKAAGINLLHVIWPATFLGLVMSIFTAYLFYQVIPTSFYMMKSMAYTDVENVIYSILKRDGRFSHPKLDYVMYVKNVNGRKLIKPEFKHRDPNTRRFDAIAQAREAELRVDFANHKILVHMRHCWITSVGDGGSVFVEDKIWPVDLPPLDEDRKTRRTDMTWEELVQRRLELNDELREIDAEMASSTAILLLANSPDGLAAHVQNLKQTKDSLLQQILSIDVELQRRPALALGCLCFVLIGCPVGIWFSRSDYLSAFVTCFLPIVFIYYPLVLCGENMARTGKLDLILSIWFANGFLGIIACGLYWRLMKH